MLEAKDLKLDKLIKSEVVIEVCQKIQFLFLEVQINVWA